MSTAAASAPVANHMGAVVPIRTHASKNRGHHGSSRVVEQLRRELAELRRQLAKGKKGVATVGPSNFPRKGGADHVTASEVQPAQHPRKPAKRLSSESHT